jgi:hypothetical protein
LITDYTVILQTPDGQMHVVTFSSDYKQDDDSAKVRAQSQLGARLNNDDVARASKVISIKRVRVG